MKQRTEHRTGKARRLGKRLAIAALALALSVQLTGCAKDGEGVALSVSVGDRPGTLDPAYAEDLSEQTILAHLYENLMRVTVDAAGRTSVTNGMAKDVDMEEEAAEGGLHVVYTFRLRSARWSDGQAVKASDFVYAWRRLADPATNSPFADLLSIVEGYQEARASGDMEQLQVTARNDSTFQVVLNGHHDWFLKEVCTSPATMPLREDVIQKLKAAASSGSSWSADPTALTVNGPYLPTGQEPGVSLTLAPNSRYYGDQPGPKEITFRFVDSPEKGKSLYDARTVDAVWPLTEDRFQEAAAVSAPVPELGVSIAVFNCAGEPFADALLREALSLAVDRNALAEAAGVGASAAEALVPSGVPESEETDFRAAGGPLLENDPEGCEARRQQAQALLTEAGYDSGANVGELEYLYAGGGENDAVAQALCQQWQEVLQLQITPKPLTQRELMSALRSGEYTVAGLDVSAAANDAECFLMSWTSGARDNVAGYESSAYDTLLTIVAGSGDADARMGCLHDAEALLMMDHVLTPLYTKGTVWTLRDSLTGAFRDPRGWFSFAGVTLRTA